MALRAAYRVNTQHSGASSMDIKIAHLSLGSNIGNRLGYLTQATKLLNVYTNINVTKISSVYETAAWGLENQDDFYNIVLEIKTSLPPKDLLIACQKIESELERTRVIHWGPRTIDIDILLYENMELRQESLTIPHKYILDRPFVTIPLTEIAADAQVNDIKISTVAKKHSKLADKCLKTQHKIEI